MDSLSVPTEKHGISYTHVDSDSRYICKGFQGGMMRKTCDRDFKLKVSRDIKSGSKTVTEVAGEFGISRPIDPRWLAEFGS